MRLRGIQARGLQIRWDADTDKRIEWETHTCRHCQKVIDVPHGSSADDIGGFCERCQSVVCPKCAAAGVCRPFAERIEANLRQQARRQAMGL